MSQTVGSSIGNLQGGARFLTPPSGSPIPPQVPPIPMARAMGILGVISTAIAVIGALGGNDFRNQQLSKFGMTYDPETGFARSTNTSGSGKNSQGIPPFTGGQSAGIPYIVRVDLYATPRSTLIESKYYSNQAFTVYGSIRGIDTATVGAEYKVYIRGNPDVVAWSLGTGFYASIRGVILSIVRQDGQNDTGGNPAGIGGGEPLYEGYAGNGGTDLANGANASRNAAPRVVPPSFSPALGWGAGKTVTSGVAGAVGIGTGVNTGLAPSTIPDRRTVPPTIPSTTPKPTPKPPEIPKPIEPPEKKVIPPPIPPVDLTKINTDLALVIGSLAAMKVPIDNINANTTPEAQKVNAKAGTCEAFKPSECGDNALKRNIDPIGAKLDAAQIARDANAGTQTGLITNVIATQGTHTGFFNSIGDKLNTAKEFASKVYEVSKLDKVYNFLTFLTVLHNAQMLSNSLIQTLESTLSLGMATVGFKDPDGNPWDINAIINKSVSDFLKEKLGASVYADLDTKWKSANRIYQAGANMVYQVRSLWDSARSIAELTGANLGQLMNTLKKDGVVSENAYPTKAESPMMVNSFMNRVQNLEEAASHLNSITSQSYGITETVKQMKDDKTAFDKLVEDSPLKKGSTNKAAADELAAIKLASPSPPLDTSHLVKPD